MSQTNPAAGPSAGHRPGPEELARLVDEMTAEPLVEGDQPVSVWMLVKSHDAEGDVVWGVREAGEHLGTEELLGALTGFTESLKRSLASDWE